MILQKSVVFLIFLFLVFLIPERSEEYIIHIPVPEPYIYIAEISEGEREASLVIEIDRISAYNPVPRQTWGDPNVSSCGPNLERQIAVSRDLFFDEEGRKHLCGTVVSVITDRGEVFEDYIIWDTMNSRYTNTVDIMLPHTNESEAFAFGITTGILLVYD